jgi:folate-binding protein YgfZ
MADLDEDYRLLQEDVGGCWIERDVVAVTGPDAVSFLQGQCSQDVAALAVGSSGWTWVLQPRGKVEVLARVTRVAADGLLLDVEGGWGDATLARLNRFKLRTKADLAPRAWRCLALRGPRSREAAAAAAGASSGTDAPHSVAETLVLDASWPRLPGVDLLGPDPALPPGVALVSAEAWEWARIDAGVPQMGRELTEDTIPAETGLVPRTVSFTKGCYTGQELVARIDSRGGHVPRHLRRVVLDEPAPAGASVAVAGKVAGSLTSVAAAPDGGAVALAYLGRDVVPPAPVVVTWPEGSTGGRALDLQLVS